MRGTRIDPIFPDAIEFTTALFYLITTKRGVMKFNYCPIMEIILWQTNEISCR